jgi:hypothetical protein
VSASTAPAAKAALLTIFAAAAGLSGVTLSWDQPTKDSDYTGEMIWLGDVQGSENWSSLGAQRREESYTVGLGVYVEQWGDDPQTVETRLWAVWAAATEALRTDLRSQPSTLRTAGVRQYETLTFRQRTGPATAEKWGAFLDGSVQLIASNV